MRKYESPKKLFFYFEGVLAKAADGAFKVFGDFFPRGAGSDAVIGIADGGVVFIAAGTYVFHSGKFLSFIGL